MEEKWKLYQEWAEEPAQQTMKGKKGTRPGKGMNQTMEENENKEEQEHVETSRSSKDNKRANATDEEDKQGKKQRNKPDATEQTIMLLNTALALKNRYHAAISSSETLIHIIENDTAKWAWARNPQNQGRLETLKNALRAHMTFDFAQIFLITKPQAIRNLFEKSALEVGLLEFNRCRDKLAELEAMHTKLCEKQKI